MKKINTVSILGNGRIARAVAHYLAPYCKAKLYESVRKNPAFKQCDLFIGALAGGIGEECLRLALHYKKHLIDISDVDPPYYLKAKEKIHEAGIVVIPGCGFSPGLANCILGKELKAREAIDSIEISAGSLSRKKNYFPFLWCFEDLVLEHQIPSSQVISGKKQKCAAFFGYRKEKYLGIPAESYFCASGFENCFDSAGARCFTTRVIRPRGFKEFFLFLKNQGFLTKDSLPVTRDIVQAHIEDNFTLAEVVLRRKKQRTVWQIKSFSRSRELLNSMQKITASVPAAVTRFIFEGALRRRGLIFMEELGKDDALFLLLSKAIKKHGVVLKRNVFKERR